MAKVRYAYMAQQADVEGETDAASVFRAVGESEDNHAMGHLEFLQDNGDPVANQPINNTLEMLQAAIISENHDASTMYPEFARGTASPEPMSCRRPPRSAAPACRQPAHAARDLHHTNCNCDVLLPVQCVRGGSGYLRAMYSRLRTCTYKYACARTRCFRLIHPFPAALHPPIPASD